LLRYIILNRYNIDILNIFDNPDLSFLFFSCIGSFSYFIKFIFEECFNDKLPIGINDKLPIGINYMNIGSGSGDIRPPSRTPTPGPSSRPISQNIMDEVYGNRSNQNPSNLGNIQTTPSQISPSEYLKNLTAQQKLDLITENVDPRYENANVGNLSLDQYDAEFRRIRQANSEIKDRYKTMSNRNLREIMSYYNNLDQNSKEFIDFRVRWESIESSMDQLREDRGSYAKTNIDKIMKYERNDFKYISRQISDILI
jgi:hypothetical protein